MQIISEEFKIETSSGELLCLASGRTRFQSLALLGRSGSGKTSLLKALLGDYASGLSYYGQLYLTHNGERLQLGRDIRVIPQQPRQAFDPHRKLYAQVSDILKQQASQSLEQDLNRLMAISHLELSDLQNYPYQLSGGQAQRLVYALATLNSPKLIIADEPTSALDSRAKTYFQQTMHQALSSGTSLIFSSHDLSLIGALSQSLLVFDNGRATFYDSSQLGELETDFLVELRSAQDHWQQLKFPKQTLSEVLLDFKNVSKIYSRKQSLFKHRDQQVLTDFNLQVKAGEVLLICGQNGAGKSTLIRMALGLESISSGSIETKVRCGVVFQYASSSFDPLFTVEQSLREVADKLTFEDLLDSLEAVGLSAAFLPRLVSHLSGGELQRLALARCLLQDCQLIFFDEPFSNLDLIHKAKLLHLLIELRQKRHLTYIFVSHDSSMKAKARHVIDLNKD